MVPNLILLTMLVIDDWMRLDKLIRYLDMVDDDMIYDMIDDEIT